MPPLRSSEKSTSRTTEPRQATRAKGSDSRLTMKSDKGQGKDCVNNVPSTSSRTPRSTQQRESSVIRPSSAVRPPSACRPSSAVRPSSVCRPSSGARPPSICRPSSDARPPSVCRPSSAIGTSNVYRRPSDISPDSPLDGEKPNDLLRRLFEMWRVQLTPSYRPYVCVSPEATAEYNLRRLKDLYPLHQRARSLRRVKASGVVVETLFYLGRKVQLTQFTPSLR